MRTVLVLLLAGCSGKDTTGTTPPDTTDTGTPPGTTDTGTPPPGPDLVVTPDANWSVTPTYRLDTLEVRSKFDALISWPTLTTDAWGEPIDPAGIADLFLLEVSARPDDLPARLAADDLGFDLLSTWTADVAGGTNAHFSDFAVEIGGTPEGFDPSAYLLQNQDKTWVLGLGSTDGKRLDLRAMAAVTPLDSSGTSAIELDAATSSVSFHASMGASSLETAEGWDLYTVDWSAVETDALGKPYDKGLGDELFVARFDSPPADLAGSALAWPATADAWYAMDVARDTDARLDFAKDAGGTVFPGFTPGPTWLVGVRCSTCLSPFPLWVSTVQVSSRDVTSGT